MSSRTKRTTPVITLAEYQYKIHRLNMVTNAVTAIVTTLGRSAIAICVAWFVYLSIDSLSGKETNAIIDFKALANLNLNKYLVILLCGGSCFWGFNERRLRKQTTARHSKRQTELERKLDPNRTSSQLPATGNTRQEDKP